MTERTLLNFLWCSGSAVVAGGAALFIMATDPMKMNLVEAVLLAIAVWFGGFVMGIADTKMRFLRSRGELTAPSKEG